MSFTFDENGTALTETLEGVTVPVDYSFKKVNDWIHGIDVQFEELQALCLGMASENDRLKLLIADIKKFDIDQYLILPMEIRQRIQAALNT